MSEPETATTQQLQDRLDSHMARYRELWTDLNVVNNLRGELDQQARDIQQEQRRLANQIAVTHGELAGLRKRTVREAREDAGRADVAARDGGRMLAAQRLADEAEDGKPLPAQPDLPPRFVSGGLPGTKR